MTKAFQFLLGWIVFILSVSFCAFSLILPLKVDAVEAAGGQPAQQVAGLYRNEGGRVIVFDNDYLDRRFGKDRSIRNSNNLVKPRDLTSPTISGEDSALVFPNRSLLTGITRGTTARRAAALRFAETGRTMIENREYQTAVVYLEKSLSLEASPFVFFYLARAHFYLGDYQRSLNFVEIAESRFERQPAWESELIALRSAAAAAVTLPAVSKRNLDWMPRDR